MDFRSRSAKIRHFIGIDRAIAYTLFSRGWQFVASFGTVLLIAHFLSPIQQGFYYTFISVLSLQVLFELGLTYVVLQFASHEYAHLNWTPLGTLQGDSTAKARLNSLIRLALKWYFVAAVFLIIVFVPAGLLFFGISPDATSTGIWKLPWAWLVLTTAASLLISPLFAVLEGCGLVADVACFRLVQDLIAYPLFWLSLAVGAGLSACPLFQTVRLLISIRWLLTHKRPFFMDLLRFRLPSVAIDWWREVWPMQWKIALSWISSFFIFQLFNPVLFAHFGAAVAGRTGMSLALTGAINTLAMAWISTKIPLFGQMIARRDYQSLDRLFFLALLQASLVALGSGIVLWGIVVALYVWQVPLSQRILEPLPFGLFLGVSVINVIVFSQAAYLRAHKEEPFLSISIALAALNAVSIMWMARRFGVLGVAAGYFGLTLLVGLGAGTMVFVKKRREWNRCSVK